MSKLYRIPRSIGGIAYDFAHLKPFQIGVDSKKMGRNLRVHVRFTTHCSIRKYDAATHAANEPTLYNAGRRKRSFCRDRYELLWRLAETIGALNHPKSVIRQTAEERNWLHSPTIDLSSTQYRISFELRRAQPDMRALQDLGLTVKKRFPLEASCPAHPACETQ
jgi:hypothetical protein